MNTKAASVTWANIVGQKVRDYKLLIKFRLTLTVVFSSVMAYFIAASGSINWKAAGILSLGGFLVTGAANALNQALEKDFDQLMKRTADRPVAAGRMKMSEAVMSAGFMSLFGITLLALFNPWTAFFGMIALMSYAFVYTPMKRISPAAVTIGAIPGALPTLIGCAAAQGAITPLGLTLFAVQFLWQFPHFWSIGWLGYEDYAKAGYKLLPTRNGQQDPATGFQSFLYALLLVPVVILPWMMGISNVWSAIITVAVSLTYAVFGWNFYQKMDRKAALQLMFFSFAYIPVVLATFYLTKL